MRNLLFLVLVVVVVRCILVGVAMVRGPGPAAVVAVESGQHSDAWWYLHIANEGYPQIADPAQFGHADRTGVLQSPWAFFPLYPLLVHGSAQLLRIDGIHAMFLLSWVLGIAALLVFHRLMVQLRGEGAALWSSIALLLFPMAIYFHVHYTEALFLLALAGAFLSVARGRSGWAAAACGALVLVRPNGLLCLLPIALFAVEHAGLEWKQVRARPGELVRRLLFLLPALLAFAGYGLYQWSMTGTPFAFSAAQAGWGRQLMWPFLAFFRSGDTATQIESVYTLLLIAATIPLWKRLPLSFNLLLWINILVPLCSGSVDSMMRFTLVLFPYFLLLGDRLQRSPVRWVVLVVFFGLQLGYWWLWLEGHPLTA